MADVKNLAHYTIFKLQPIEFFRANKGVLDFMQMCAIKYICRYQYKNGLEDLLKARNYIDMMIEDWNKEHPPIQSHEQVEKAVDKLAALANKVPPCGPCTGQPIRII